MSGLLVFNKNITEAQDSVARILKDSTLFAVKVVMMMVVVIVMTVVVVVIVVLVVVVIVILVV
jgi:hypothetical protein